MRALNDWTLHRRFLLAAIGLQVRKLLHRSIWFKSSH